jgi:hypothetical protein
MARMILSGMHSSKNWIYRFSIENIIQQYDISIHFCLLILKIEIFLFIFIVG